MLYRSRYFLVAVASLVTLADKPRPSEFERELIAVVALEEARGPRERALVCVLIAVYAERRARSRHLGRPGVAIMLC